MKLKNSRSVLVSTENPESSQSETKTRLRPLKYGLETSLKYYITAKRSEQQESMLCFDPYSTSRDVNKPHWFRTFRPPYLICFWSELTVSVTLPSSWPSSTSHLHPFHTSCFVLWLLTQTSVTSWFLCLLSESITEVFFSYTRPVHLQGSQRGVCDSGCDTWFLYFYFVLWIKLGLGNWLQFR